METMEFRVKTNCGEYVMHLDKTRKDFFLALCNDDSIVREAVFSAFNFFTKLPYDFFYYLWLGDERKAFETLYSDNSIGKFREIDD